ncbi:hypothetical protein KY289_020730 [Solanum tuberosum]|nr:hypothetical protein KY289_020730 [Solanum tuberosum]
MSKMEKIQFCNLIKEVKFPDAYVSNISRCVKEARLLGLKSHDHHVLFQHIIPLIIKEILPKDAYDPLIELSLFFTDLCAKELHVEKLDQLDKSIRITICKLERVFLPTFFDVMIHLAIHLANEAKLAGPVQYRWMYYIEREHLEILTKENNKNVFKRHKEEFSLWFEEKVVQLKENGDDRITDELFALARLPDSRVYSHNGYTLNGFRFRTKDSELFLKTQNSGVVVKSDEHTENVDYYGRIRKILEISYISGNSVILFQCDWFEVPPQGRSQSRGYKRDEYGFVCVDVTQIHYTNDPFILGSQAQSVYYLKHGQNEKWHAVVRVRPRNLYDVPEQESEPEPYQLIDLVERGETSLQVESDNDNVIIQREDIDGVSIEAPSLNNEEEIDLEYIMMTNVPVSESIGTTNVISHPQSGQKRMGRGKTTRLSIQKKRKNINGKLSVIIPPDQRVAVGPGANDFVTEISVKVF